MNIGNIEVCNEILSTPIFWYESGGTVSKMLVDLHRLYGSLWINHEAKNRHCTLVMYAREHTVYSPINF